MIMILTMQSGEQYPAESVSSTYFDENKAVEAGKDVKIQEGGWKKEPQAKTSSIKNHTPSNLSEKP